MSRLTKQDRLVILELAADIASEAAQNPNVVWMIEFQEKLVETLYRKMTAMLEFDLEQAEEEDWDDEEEEDEDEDEHEEEEQAATAELHAANKKQRSNVDKKGKKGSWRRAGFRSALRGF